MKKTHIGLFAGIGGFEFAAREMGYETLAWCEINPTCQRVLKYHFPNAKEHSHIKQTDFTQYENKVKLLTGGFPCQPFSVAGSRRGSEDPRYLWKEMLRAIREVKPQWVLGENVRGIVSWNEGLVFEQVQTDLEAEGYQVQAFILPACAINAPHRRDRVWFVAYANNEGRSSRFGKFQKENGEISERNDNAQFGNASSGIATDPQPLRMPTMRTTRTTTSKERVFEWFCDNANATHPNQNTEGQNGYSHPNERRKQALVHTKGQKRKWEKLFNSGFLRLQWDVANTNGTRLQKRPANTEPTKQRQSSRTFEKEWFANFPTQSPICSRDDGLSDRLVGITFSGWRRKAIEGFGNAVVPPLVMQLLKAIDEVDEKMSEHGFTGF